MDDTQKSTPVQAEVPQEIRTFLEGILIEANLATIDADFHEEMIRQLYIRLDAFLVAKIIDALPDEKIEEFITIDVGGQDPKKIQEFLSQHIEKTQEFMMGALDEFAQLYLGSVAQSRADQAIDHFDKVLADIAKGIHPSLSMPTKGAGDEK
jgi:hypothetical protein